MGMGTRTQAWVIALSLVLASGVVSAESEESAFARKGWYAGAGFGAGFDQFDSSQDYDTGLGFDLWGGYRLHRYVSAEMQLEYLTNFDTDLSTDMVEGNMTAFTLNAKATPLTGRFQPFALVGVGGGWYKSATLSKTFRQSGFVARFGGGLDTYLTEQVVLEVGASYVLTTGGLDGRDWVSLAVGIQYRF